MNQKDVGKETAGAGIRCLLPLTILAVLSMLCVTAQAEPVHPAMAQRVSENWISRVTGVPTTGAIEVDRARRGGVPTAFHVFDVQPQGYVIVSADDIAQPVVFYSPEGAWPGVEIPPQLQAMLEAAAADMRLANEHDAEAPLETLQAWLGLSAQPGKALAPRPLAASPVLTARWGQGFFYNADCPFDPSAVSGRHASVGYGAVALGQIMHVHAWPPRGTGSHSYWDLIYGTQSADFGATTYNWLSMPSQLFAHDDDVAQLLYHIGVSINTKYGPTNSSVDSALVPHALRTYWSYNCSDWIPRSQYTDADWLAMLRSDLNAGRPIYYEGKSGSANHKWAFVIDGYQGTSFFHMNFGRQAFFAGYFYLDDITPSEFDNFSYFQSAVMNIEPDITTFPVEPFMIYDNHFVDDDNNGDSIGNGDGAVNAGETLELVVTLANTGRVNATNVIALLTTNDSAATIIDGVENYGAIPARSTGACLDDYVVAISPSALDGQEIVFNLNITSNEGFWTDSFTLKVNQLVVYESHVFDDDAEGESDGNDDGLLNPGETIELLVALQNLGSTLATNVSSSISTTDPYVTWTGNNGSAYPDLVPNGSSAFNYDDYELKIDPTAPDGHVITFTVLIQTDQGTWTDTFTMTVEARPLYETYLVDDDATGESNGNDDGEVNPGESVELYVGLHYSGPQLDASASSAALLHNVSSAISTTDPYVTWTGNTISSWPDIASGTTEFNLDDFEFDISPTTPDGHEITFTLVITADEGIWTDTFTMVVRDRVVYDSHIIDDDTNGESDGNGDGEVDSGETVELLVGLRYATSLVGNPSAAALIHNVSSAISTSDPYVTWLGNTDSSWPDLAPGFVEYNTDDFEFSVDDKTPHLHEITFDLLIQSNEGTWTEQFTVTVYGKLTDAQDWLLYK